MKKWLVIAFVLIGSVVYAQNPTVGPNDSFGWGQTGPDLATVQAYAYKYYLDGATTGSLWTNVTCSGTVSPFACQAKTPTFSNGSHSITLTAANAGGESPQSVPFAFVFGNPPTTPNNIHVIKG